VADARPIDLTDHVARTEEIEAAGPPSGGARAWGDPRLRSALAAVPLVGFPAVLGGSGLLRGLDLAVVAVVGAAAWVSCLALFLAPRGAVPPARPAAVASAFVCSKCAEYTAPPDWSALLEGSDPPTSGSPPVLPRHDPGPLARRAPVPLPSGFGPFLTAGAVSPPTTVYIPPPARRAPTAYRWEPGLTLLAGRLVPLPAEPVPFSTVGGSGTGSVPSVGTLEHWIATESEGLVTRSRRAFSAPCAACRQEQPSPYDLVRCMDCARPICDPCRTRAIERDGGAWCPPCAVNRLSAEFLAVLEAPTLDEPVAAGGP